MIKKYALIFILLYSIFAGSLYAQIASRGTPVFKNRQKEVRSRAVEMPKLKRSYLKSMKEANIGNQLKVLQYAHKFELNLTPHNSGRWDVLSDGRRVWRLALSSRRAYSIGIQFSRYRLPRGAQLFIYNNESERVLGAYTLKNNKSFNKLAVEPIKGETAIIEYIEPATPEFPAELEVGALLHDFLDVFQYLRSASLLKEAGACNVNINCPDGADWQLEKNSVVRTLKGGKLSSGALINNTRNDGRPYVLTANHVIEDHTEASLTVFHFNYESADCNGTSGPLTNTISGANLRATTPKLDFSLVELTEVPPDLFKPYYAGWNRVDAPAQNTTCIHHPDGDIKKISIDSDSPVTGTFNTVDTDYDPETHWQVLEWEVGTTEPGSSGSPLFDENRRIIGDLSGGVASCGNSINDFYAKLSDSWDDYPDPSEQLKFWLDPDNTGAFVLNGFNPRGDFFADFLIGAEELCIGEGLILTDLSEGGPVSYSWEFGEGALPATADGPGPHTVVYQTGGNKSIKLIIQKDGEIDSISKTFFVEEPVDPGFSFKVKGRRVFFADTSANAESVTWNFGDGDTSVEQNPEHLYSLPGTYTVTLEGENVCGTESIEKDISTSYEKLVSLYPNPTNGVITVDLSRLLFDRLFWTVYDAGGAQMANGIITDGRDNLNLDLTGYMGGVYIIRLQIDGNLVTRKMVLTGHSF